MKRFVAWLIVWLLALMVTEVRLSHGEHRRGRIPLTWYRDK